jgi:hypothetical protein
LAVVIGCVLLLSIGFAVYDLASQRREVEQLKTQLAELQPQLKVADATIARVSFAQRWQGQDPKFLACLKHLTEAFPEDGQIWATRLTLQDDGRGTLEGQSASGDPSKALRRLEDSGHFKEVKVVTIGEAGKNSRDISFSATFRFTGATEPAPAAPPSRGAVNTGGRAALDKADPGKATPQGATTTPATGPATGPATLPAGDRDDDSNGRRRRRGNR